MTDYAISNHAAERYQERVRPTLDRAQAEKELRRLIAMAGPPVGRPDWLHIPERDDEISEHYLELSDGIMAPLAKGGHWIPTIIVRATSTPQHRRNRNERKARKRKAKRFASHASVARRSNSRPRGRDFSWEE